MDAPAEQPLVSVGMPVFNGERFVAAAIRSVLDQTVTALELVISDNGSDDATAEICRAAAAQDPRVRFFREPVNRGAAWNFNRVLQLARGVYFHWAASDDLWAPTFAERCLNRLREDPAAILAYSSTTIIDADGEVTGQWQPPPGYASGSSAALRYRDVLWKSVMCFEVFGVMRRAQLVRTPGIAAFTGSDRSLLAELALMGSFAHVDEPLFVNRVHPSDSLHSHPDPVHRARWFNPDSAARFPTWRLLRGFVEAAWRGAPDLPGRAGALRWIPAWTWHERGALAFDVLRALPGPMPGIADSVRAQRMRKRAGSRGGTPD